ncbi:unannotated protein [freshwater metagenome]|uniref:Unannotated protein n=1 Tax=freshwater metagenome TaxID=449393 RepID=A0A6J7TNS3_9ZZZZ
MAIWLLRNSKTACFCFFTNIYLFSITERKDGAIDLFAIEYSKNIGLIFQWIYCAMQRATYFGFASACIVAGDNAIESHRLCAIENCCKFNLLIATKTWVRCAPCLVFAHKVFDDAFVEFIGHIPDIERNTDDICGATCIM